jgi:formate--tetrahydrofolate ligase
MLVLENAIYPNLVVTKAGTPALVHMGPFANIAHGCNSVIATKQALGLTDYVVTECGFASDLGFEKFCDLKVPLINKVPDCVVIVTNIRDLKYHGSYENQNTDSLANGINNLAHHIGIVKKYGLNYVVAINSFDADSPDDRNFLEKWLKDNQHPFAFHYAFKEMNGAKDLAKIVVELCDRENHFNSIIKNKTSLEERILCLAKELYNATDVRYSKRAKATLEYLVSHGFDHYPICVAKTHLSISHDSKILNLPSNYTFEIDDFQVSNGAGFIVVLTKGIVRLPGLNEDPRAMHMNFLERKL